MPSLVQSSLPSDIPNRSVPSHAHDSSLHSNGCSNGYYLMVDDSLGPVVGSEI